MNYFPFHVGDYVASTAHLSWDEDMAYTRLIRVYYQTEKPIPKDKAYRLARATTNSQKAAVDSVLEEFFTLDADGYHQSRCEEEIAKFSDKQSKAKRSADARWKQSQTQCEPDANAMRTHSEGNANQEPITNNQLIPPIPPSGAEDQILEKQKPKAIALPTWLEKLKTSGEKPIPEDDPVFSYAEKAGLPDEHLRLCWREFRTRYSQPDAKRYRDWRAVFRKAVRGNWFKLWWLDADGNYALTTCGKQAERVAA